MKLNLKNRTKLLIIFVFFILFFGLLIYFFFYFPNFEILLVFYQTLPLLVVLTTVVFLRIVISLYTSYFLLKRWINQEKKTIVSFPFIFSVFFFLFLPAKMMDLMMYLAYRLFETYSYSYQYLIFVIKIRYVFGVLSVLPLFLGGIYLYFFRLKLKYETIVIKKILLLFASIYIAFFSFIIIVLNNVESFTYVGALLVISSVSFIIWIFLKAHKERILNTINSLTLGIGFILYLISSALIPILITFLGLETTLTERINTFYIELSTFFSSIIITVGLIKKPKKKSIHE